MDRLLLDKIKGQGDQMRVRVVVSVLAGLSLLMGFQNCGGPMGVEGSGFSVPEKSQPQTYLSGRFEVKQFIATSGCPDVALEEGLACSSIYQEQKAEFKQVVEFMSDGTLIVEGVCNTYYSSYELESQEGLGRFNVADLTGTSNGCDGEQADEESLLVYRLTQAVRMVDEGPDKIIIFTDQSSALGLSKKL